jgi:hypothetical protein
MQLSLTDPNGKCLTAEEVKFGYSESRCSIGHRLISRSVLGFGLFGGEFALLLVLLFVRHHLNGRMEEYKDLERKLKKN